MVKVKGNWVTIPRGILNVSSGTMNNIVVTKSNVIRSLPVSSNKKKK